VPKTAQMRPNRFHDKRQDLNSTSFYSRRREDHPNHPDRSTSERQPGFQGRERRRWWTMVVNPLLPVVCYRDPSRPRDIAYSSSPVIAPHTPVPNSCEIHKHPNISRRLETPTHRKVKTAAQQMQETIQSRGHTRRLSVEAHPARCLATRFLG
jgi:hypothetical protein